MDDSVNQMKKNGQVFLVLLLYAVIVVLIVLSVRQTTTHGRLYTDLTKSQVYGRVGFSVAEITRNTDHESGDWRVIDADGLNGRTLTAATAFPEVQGGREGVHLPV